MVMVGSRKNSSRKTEIVDVAHEALCTISVFSPPLPPDAYGGHTPRDPWAFYTPSAQLLCSLYSPLLFLSFPLLVEMCFFV